MVSKTIVRLLHNARFGLNNVSRVIIDSFKREETLEAEELKRVKKEMRAVRKQILIIEEEIG